MRPISRIVKNLFDTDTYKLRMLQFIWKHCRKNRVTFTFKNRTDVDLLKYMTIEEVHDELMKIKPMKFTEEMVDKIRKHPTLGKKFCEEFLSWLVTDFRLAPIRVWSKHGKLMIASSGDWVDVTLWETFIMNVVNRLYFQAKMKELGVTEEDVLAEGRRRLQAKIARMSTCELLRFMEFGTRRRWSYEWQREVLIELMRRLPNQLIGTSNIDLAFELGLEPKGTMAHELDMGLQGVFYEEDDKAGYMWSHDWLKTKWLEMYGSELSIFLPDTYGTDYFLAHFTEEEARASKGTRQDSGDPIAYGNKFRTHYEKFGIDSRTKALLFSDGLTDESMVDLTNRFIEEFLVAHGYGTHCSNDMGFDDIPDNRGLKPLSLIAKLTRSNGHFTVKLSDNPSKAQGTKKAIKRIFRLTGYNKIKHTAVECVV